MEVPTPSIRKTSTCPTTSGRPRDDLTQPLHALGVLVILNKLEAVHQFVSPAKYFAD